jgi:transcriptional regulator with PAS, ATPase and Fis domain
VDVRIIAATNRDLEQMVAEKKLRKDLFFRINVVNLIVPPLRERAEDILPLTYYFLDKYNRQYRLGKQIDQAVIARLLAHDWPGNVRELENLIEQLVVITPGEIITADRLPVRMGMSTDCAPLFELGQRPLGEMMAEVERRILEAAMQRCKTTREAARILGVNQSTIVRKLNRYKIKD